MTPERILVTGGAGFIGSHTVDLLLRHGKQVVVLDNLSSGKMENLDIKHPNLEFVEGDVLEYPLVVDLLAGCDAVLHLAAIASVQYSIENPIYSFQVNTQGFLHVLEAVRKAKRPIRLVYASSAAVYGEANKLPCQDDQPLSGLPLSPYALQKIDDEYYADLYARLHSISSLGLRYFNVYGSRQDPASPYSGVISRFLDGYKKGIELIIYGDGQQSRDFIYVSDVAMANCLALQSECRGALNIATGHPETLLNLVKYIEAAGHHPIKYDFVESRPGDIKSSYAATKSAEQQLGFKYTISLREGVKLLMS
jgi:nucleoside-diphosphate-sugar epimerase